MDSLQLRVGGFLLSFWSFVMWLLSPRILPVCFAAFAFANILVFTYQKKKLSLYRERAIFKEQSLVGHSLHRCTLDKVHHRLLVNLKLLHICGMKFSLEGAKSNL